MNPPEQELAKKIVRHLDDGASRVEPGVRERLLAARRLALARHRERPAPAFGLAWAGQVAARFGAPGSGLRYLVAASVLVVALAVVIAWQGNGASSELADIDSGLLTDELPINAYLDKGFDSWLKRSSR